MKNNKEEGEKLKETSEQIMLKRPTNFSKRYYSIGEVAGMFPYLTASKIRFWEKHFKTIKPKKDTAGNRRFTKKDIDALRVVYYLVQDKGYTLDGAKREIGEKAKVYEQKIDIIDSLTDIKLMLLKIKEEVGE